MCERKVLTSDCIHLEVALTVTLITASLRGSPLKRGKGKKRVEEPPVGVEGGKSTKQAPHDQRLINPLSDQYKASMGIVHAKPRRSPL